MTICCVLWPFFSDNTNGIGTHNPSQATGAGAVLQLLPLAVARLHELPVAAGRDPHGGPGETNTRNGTRPGRWWNSRAAKARPTSRVWPFFSQSHNEFLEDDWYLWPVYKYNRLTPPRWTDRRTRILFFLYSAINQNQHRNRASRRRTDFLPFYTPRREFDGNERCQVLSILEPFFPDNREHRSAITARCAPSGARSKIPHAARPASRCSGTFTGGTPRRRRKKSRSCSVFFSINPVRTARAGACFIFRWAAQSKPAAGIAVAELCRINLMFQSIGEIVLLFLRTLRSLPLAWRHRAEGVRPVF